jgi:hypothetical protein
MDEFIDEALDFSLRMLGPVGRALADNLRHQSVDDRLRQVEQLSALSIVMSCAAIAAAKPEEFQKDPKAVESLKKMFDLLKQQNPSPPAAS